jgi:hypothetical protein
MSNSGATAGRSDLDISAELTILEAERYKDGASRLFKKDYPYFSSSGRRDGKQFP